jgi:GNAT superfamily N-acetyltransferase
LSVSADVRIVPVDPHDDTALQSFHSVVEESDRYERPYSLTWTPHELAVAYRAAPTSAALAAWLAFAGDVAVGALETHRPLQDNLHLLNASVSVVPAARRQGVGTRLARQAFALAREHNRPTLSAWVAGALTDPTGRALSDDLRPGEAFAASWGLTNRLTDLHRVLDLPVAVERLDELAAQVATHSADYQLVLWVGPCPVEYVDPYCRLRSSIVAEAPRGELELEDEAYDETRLRIEERELEQMQRTAYTAAALSPDGDLVGHTMLVVAGTDPGRVYQWDTLVLPEHRGHRLGLALKVANQARMQEEHPEVTELHTFNAADNPSMSAVNDVLGFRAVELVGEWQGPVPPD